MNISKCLLVTLLGVALLLAISFLSLYLAKKSSKVEKPELDLTKKMEESKLRSAQLKDKLEQNRKEILSDLKEQHEEYIKKSQEKFKAGVEGLKSMFPDLNESIPQIPKTMDLELLLDVNLPKLGSVSYYKVKDQTISISRQQTGNIVKFTHQRPVGSFNISKVHFGGVSYPVPRVENVFIVTSLSLLNDIVYPYYLIVASADNKAVIFENVGDKFIESVGDIKSFEDAMRQKAVSHGRPSSREPIPIPEPLPVPDPMDVPEEQEASSEHFPPISFNLTANMNFEVEGFNFDVSSADEFDKYTKYMYLDNSKPFTVRAFTDGVTEQIGLPLNVSIHSLLVYLLKGTQKPALVVKISLANETKYFRNNLNNTWVPVDSTYLEESLDYSDSLLNDRVVLNLARRSDYYRNGSGESSVEPTKDVNVYVEVDRPGAGWSTFRHNLEVGGEGGELRNFNVSKIIFGNRTSETKPTKLCKHVDVYTKSDYSTAIPLISAKYYDDTQEYFRFDGSNYVSSPEINESNLVEKLQTMTT